MIDGDEEQQWEHCVMNSEFLRDEWRMRGVGGVSGIVAERRGGAVRLAPVA